MSKLFNRNVNSTISIFGLHQKLESSIHKIDPKHNFDDSSKYLNHDEGFDYQTKDHGNKTVESDAESITLDLNKLSGLSSSSSLSWSDDYETETTKKVYDELRRLDRVLKGEEPIPPDYNMEECKEWMDYFPNLSIFDEDPTPTNSIENLCWNKLSLKDEDEDNFPKYSDIIIKSGSKSGSKNVSSPKIVITNDETSVIPRRRSLKRQNRVLNNNIFFSSKPLSFDVEQYLKVSPVIQNKRNQSSKSLLHRQISRESPDYNREYSSLPHLKLESLPNLKVQKSSHTWKKKSYSKMSVKNNNRLILPPIEVDQFRSVSAIPSDQFKPLSALSANPNFKDGINKKIHSTGPKKNLVIPRRQRNILL